MKLLLLGANGQVGRELQRSLSVLGDIVCCDRSKANLEQIDKLQAFILDVNPDIIVNAAAYTAVDKAEEDIELATKINSQAVEAIAETSKKIDALLVHYSTDYVFDGKQTTPYKESDTTSPLSVYGRTKLQGEQAIIKSDCKHLIFRTSWVYALHGNNFIKTILRLAKEKPSLNIINDQHGAPTSAELIADITSHCIKTVLNAPQNTNLMGIYHLAASGKTNWYDLAKYIIDHTKPNSENSAQYKTQVNPMSSLEYGAAATRPENSTLNCNKLRKTFGLNLPEWQYHVNLTLNELIKDG